jgi:hypothetical protein
MEYAIVKSGIVENIIEWDGVSEYTVDGELVLADDSAWIGAKYDGAFEAEPIPPDTRTYIEKRRAEYESQLPMGDQFDAILKGFDQLRLGGQDLPADLDGVIDIWLGIKSAIPKE